MRPWMLHSRSREFTVSLALLTAVLVLSILLFPERAFQASLGGLTVWWNIVFPSLLPFLMLAEMMNGFGAVRGIGTLLEPLTRLLFRIPGSGGWAVALGAVAGMPAGAEAAGKLRRDNLVSREEGERIVALSHVASPFFILTVIGAGFLHSVEAGAIIAVVHYSSAIGVGLLMRRHGKGSGASTPLAAAPSEPKLPGRRNMLLARALLQMHNARLQDGRSFGKLLGDSVAGAIQTLMMIGGTMIVFSVLLGIFDTIGVARLLSALASAVFPPSAAPSETVNSLLSGTFELHVGAHLLSRLPFSGPAEAALIGAALAWSGLAVHLQVKTAIRHTDLRYRHFLLSRCLHAGLAVVLTFLLWRPLSVLFDRAEPSFGPGYGYGASAVRAGDFSLWSVWADVPGRLLQLGLILALVVALSLLVSLLRRAGKPA